MSRFMLQSCFALFPSLDIWSPLKLSLRYLWLLPVTTVLAGVAIYSGRFWYIERNLRAGKAALAAQDFTLAQTYLAQCLRYRPADAEVLLLAAQAARRGDDLTTAESHLLTLHRLQAATTTSALESALVRAQQSDFSLVRDAQRLLAEQDPQAAILIQEAMAKGWLTITRVAEALACADLILERQPDHCTGRLLRGHVMELLQQEEDALHEYEAAFQSQPNSVAARMALAELLLRLGHVSDAIGHLEWVRERQPAHTRCLLLLARCRFVQHDMAGAEQLLDVILRDQPNGAAALAERGLVALHRGQLDAALEWLQKAIDHKPYDRDAFFNYHLLLIARGENAVAEKHAERASRIDADRKRLTELRGQLAQNPRDVELQRERVAILRRLGYD